MKPLHVVTIILGLLLASLVVLYFWPEKPPKPTPVVDLEKPPVAPPEREPEIRYPLPEAKPSAPAEKEAVRPLPTLAASDPYVKDLLAQLYGEKALQQLFVPQEFIRRMVLVIDALPRQELPRQHLPLRSPLGKFQTSGAKGAEVIAAENSRRYAPYIRLAEAVPTHRLKTAYLRIYPLIEQAYRELGHPRGYFHDRMIEVLDHLLATPEVDEPIPLVEHVNRYRYADPQLESLSSGQKILLRMGRENAGRVKKVLQRLRDQLVDAAEAAGQNGRV